MYLSLSLSVYLSLYLPLYGLLSFLCGKIFRTQKYQYFGWFDRPTINIDVFKYVLAQKHHKTHMGSALSLRLKFVRKKVLSLIMGHNNLCGKIFRTIYVVRKNFPHKKFVRKKLFLTFMG